MTSSTPDAPQPQYADRAFRSPMGVVGGVLLLGLGVWMTADAVASGTGRTPWLALAALLTAAPLVIAFTLRPVVYAGDARMRVRNPFRTITIPWTRIAELRSGFSNEVLAGDTKYQLWSIPVSLRARKKATRRAASPARATAAPGIGLGVGRGRTAHPEPDRGPVRAPSDQAMDDLRELAERNAAKEGATGEITIRWAYEVIAPAVAGAVILAVLLATG